MASPLTSYKIIYSFRIYFPSFDLRSIYTLISTLPLQLGHQTLGRCSLSLAHYPLFPGATLPNIAAKVDAREEDFLSALLYGRAHQKVSRSGIDIKAFDFSDVNANLRGSSGVEPKIRRYDANDSGGPRYFRTPLR